MSVPMLAATTLLLHQRHAVLLQVLCCLRHKNSRSCPDVTTLHWHLTQRYTV
jgi:hypothetical protein